jgi:peptidoglycan-associated lipoprotein
MRLKKLAQIMLVSCAVLSLGACSSMRHKSGDDSAAVTDANGAMASGVGQGDEFGGTGSSSQSARKNIYYFDFDRSDVHDEDKPAIFANADYLVAHPNAKIILEGHTDPRGSREYNVALGEHRANAVADLMKSKGVNPNQIRVVSYGAERLAVPGRSEEDFRLDRRAVVAYQQK